MRELNQNELTAIAGGDLEDDIRTMSASWGAAGGVLGSIAGTISNILGRQDENKPSMEEDSVEGHGKPVLNESIFGNVISMPRYTLSFTSKSDW